MIDVDLDVVGLAVGADALAAMPDNLSKAVKRAVYETAMLVFDDSQALVPVRYGALRASGQMIPPQSSGDTTWVDIVYGGAAAAYAVYVHENMTARHASPTQAKYLEQPLLNNENDFASRLESALSDVMKGQ